MRWPWQHRKTAEPGDIVHYDGEDRVVVDVTGDGIAVLRRPQDVLGENLTAVPVADLEIVGRLR